jgi:hypothetical protein
MQISYVRPFPMCNTTINVRTVFRFTNKLMLDVKSSFMPLLYHSCLQVHVAFEAALLQIRRCAEDRAFPSWQITHCNQSTQLTNKPRQPIKAHAI